jgi:multidrug efflux pump subunit AcrA (membrane-fusion protein)
MRTARDELINLNSAVEEKSIVLEQSKYEPPAMIRQAQLEMEKAQRAHEQAKKNYQLKREQALAKMKEVSAALSQAQRKFEEASSVVEEFEIKAPKDGMLIYEKDWDGKKKVVGTTISAWDPVVATLPDLSSMISKTYVNEVDISKIKVDQPVEIGIDAFPEKKFKGKVIEVANVGEQRPQSDSKVFEVKIKMQGSDTLLRPSMTTSNRILTASFKSVLHIPLECIHTSDSVSFVFVKDGFKNIKKQVTLGLINDSEAIITKGLVEGDKVYLSKPEDADDLAIQMLK